MRTALTSAELDPDSTFKKEQLNEQKRQCAGEDRPDRDVEPATNIMRVTFPPFTRETGLFADTKKMGWLWQNAFNVI